MKSRAVLSGRVLALLGVLATGACGSKTPTSPSAPAGPPPAGAAISYAAIGASDALGIGATVSCLPFVACPDGTGYVADVVRQLKAGRPSVTLMNLGIPAAVIGPDIQAIAVAAGRQTPGNFLDQEMPFVPRDSTVVTIFAGGNDVNAIADAVNQGSGGTDPAAYIDTQIRAFAADYQSLVRGIRSRAPNAWIVAANLPNFAGVPFTSGYSTLARQVMQRISVGFTTQAVNVLTAQSVAVVDLMCDPKSYDRTNYSSDGFHPNDAGYSNMAAELVKAITTAGYPTPKSSCAQMTLVPGM